MIITLKVTFKISKQDISFYFVTYKVVPRSGRQVAPRHWYDTAEQKVIKERWSTAPVSQQRGVG